MTAEGPMLLVLLVGDVRAEALRDAIATRAVPPRRVHVVAPTVVTPLDWLATADDDARRAAEVRALEVEWTLADQADVDGEAGDVDPVQATEDTLRRFPAEEILIAGADADRDLEDALAFLGLPVGRLEHAPPPRRSPAFRALRFFASGSRNEVPFVLFLGVNGALLLLGVALSLFALLVLWLIGSL